MRNNREIQKSMMFLFLQVGGSFATSLNDAKLFVSRN
jgi:hypothetical protein